MVCYTNHALDQFLEDLLDIGIPDSNIVRLGGKSTTRTASLMLQKQKHNRSRADWQEIDRKKQRLQELSTAFNGAFKKYQNFRVSSRALMEHLEFYYEEYYDAFHVPKSNNNMQTVGRQGKTIRPYFLLEQWTRGFDAATLKNLPHVKAASRIWGMSKEHRQQLVNRWSEEIVLQEVIEKTATLGDNFNGCERELKELFGREDAAVLRTKRIIGCTTTAAAMYRQNLAAANPGILLVEEAGEILESHILTAMGPGTKQLILIGDHK